jgi:hypothetical protein
MKRTRHGERLSSCHILWTQITPSYCKDARVKPSVPVWKTNFQYRYGVVQCPPSGEYFIFRSCHELVCRWSHEWLSLYSEILNSPLVLTFSAKNWDRTWGILNLGLKRKTPTVYIASRRHSPLGWLRNLRKSNLRNKLFVIYLNERLREWTYT